MCQLCAQETEVKKRPKEFLNGTFRSAAVWVFELLWSEDNNLAEKNCNYQLSRMHFSNGNAGALNWYCLVTSWVLTGISFYT